MSQILDRAHGTPDGVRYRVHLFQQRGSVGMVLRLIPPEVPPFDRLDLPQAWTPGGGDSNIGAPGHDEFEIDRFDK